jgi:hypothetical protein
LDEPAGPAFSYVVMLVQWLCRPRGSPGCRVALHAPNCASMTCHAAGTSVAVGAGAISLDLTQRTPTEMEQPAGKRLRRQWLRASRLVVCGHLSNSTIFASLPLLWQRGGAHPQPARVLLAPAVEARDRDADGHLRILPRLQPQTSKSVSRRPVYFYR